MEKKHRLNKMDVYLMVVGFFDLIVLGASILYSFIFQEPLAEGFYTFALGICGGEALAGVLLEWIDAKHGKNQEEEIEEEVEDEYGFEEEVD